jgi:hypothetical protein
VAAVSDLLHRLHRDGPAAAEDVVDTVVKTLLTPPVRDELFHAMVVANERADAQWSLRDDLYLCPDGSEPRSEIALQALQHVLLQDEQRDPPLPVEAARKVLEGIDYKGWRFHLLERPDGAQLVQVQAIVPDSYGRSREVSVSRRGWGRASLLESAFAAVMQIEEHEARERFNFDGRLVFDPHADSSHDPVPALLQQSAAHAQHPA